MFVQRVLPLLVLPVWSCDIFLKVNEVKFVQSGSAHGEEQQVGGEDLVVSVDPMVFPLFCHQTGKQLKNYHRSYLFWCL